MYCLVITTYLAIQQASKGNSAQSKQAARTDYENIQLYIAMLQVLMLY